jgi:hypothetical protein
MFIIRKHFTSGALTKPIKTRRWEHNLEEFQHQNIKRNQYDDKAIYDQKEFRTQN